MDKGLAQGGDERERTATEKYGRLDVASVGQRHYSLHGDSVKDGGGDIFPACIPGYQVLNVRLAEHAAACCYGIYLCGIQCQTVQFAGLNAQQYGHLVDESTCPPCTVAVHAEVCGFSMVEEYHFGVFPSYVDHGAHRRIFLLYGLDSGYHFLNEWQSVSFRESHSYGACNGHGRMFISSLFLQLFQQCYQGFLSLCMMSFVS